MKLKSQAIWAISLQRSLNSAKLTWHSPQYLSHHTKIINLALSISHVRKKQGQEEGSCSPAGGEGWPFPRTGGDENPFWIVLYSLETD